MACLLAAAVGVSSAGAAQAQADCSIAQIRAGWLPQVGPPFGTAVNLTKWDGGKEKLKGYSDSGIRVNFHVDRQGRVQKATVIGVRSLDAKLKIERIVKNARFEPATMDGCVVASTVNAMVYSDAEDRLSELRIDAPDLSRRVLPALGPACAEQRLRARRKLEGDTSVRDSIVRPQPRVVLLPPPFGRAFQTTVVLRIDSIGQVVPSKSEASGLSKSDATRLLKAFENAEFIPAILEGCAVDGVAPMVFSFHGRR